MDYSKETSWFSSLRRTNRRKSIILSPHADLPSNAKSMCDVSSNAVGGCNVMSASRSMTQVSPLRVTGNRKPTWRDKFRITKKVHERAVTASTHSKSIEMLDSVCELKPAGSQFWSLPRKRTSSSTPTRQLPSRLRSHSSSTLVNNRRSTIWYHSPERVSVKNDVSFRGNAQIGYVVRFCHLM